MKRLAILALLVAAACGDDSRATPDGAMTGGDSGGDGSVATGTFTAFVLDLVANQTNSTAPPVAFATFEALPDPDAAANNTAAYASLFP